MKIIEEFTKSKLESGSHSEDGIYYNQHFVVLVDGATSKGNFKWQGKKSGEIAKNVVLEAFNEIKYDIKKNELIEKLNGMLRKKMQEIKIEESAILDWLRVSIVIYSDYHKKIWSYGDCKYIVNQKLLSKEKLIDTELAGIRSVVNRIYGVDVKELDIGREFIKPLLVEQYKFENTNHEFGYPVLNGYVKKLLPIIEVDVSEGDEIVFASDGYFNVKPTLNSSEKTLMDALKEDPTCCSLNKQTKGMMAGYCSFDDRSYIRFNI
ncbi:hypothetical protein GCM10012290_25640 [Halolactibacillus alkaliphilus]|uniref:PPM-type phosphatase domain-containing protein n=1 Tax=Halolactibacillus alkaliphilus TaxID=442899 RepID=A0A511X507_9BACI|nr:hypothetical protein [Halolactibacillus alkaliphilus]GEN58036.1 hypothetical protein HAL01_25000 [Halolactibacillus alkaliphilus]GGN76185.1 hypothetical protein GCM10012290_25640 [Halolactibacillus alkaliphilus]SFP11417.1 glycerophosphoryl diester phosphodiesterase [Halolactibacillus alkaliphilus]